MAVFQLQNIYVTIMMITIIFAVDDGDDDDAN